MTKILRKLRKKVKTKLPQAISPAVEMCYDICRWLLQYILQPGRRKTFVIDGINYRYFWHWYSSTWQSERAVEIPIAHVLLKNYKTKLVLEIGNVMYHYFNITHTVIDQYEKSKYSKLINEDILNYNPLTSYDLILCISTLEHIGMNIPPAKRETVLIAAVEKIRALLSPEGIAMVSFPTGYNTSLDFALKSRRIVFNKIHCLIRCCIKNNEWKTSTLEKTIEQPYIRPFPSATGLIIGYLESKKVSTMGF